MCAAFGIGGRFEVAEVRGEGELHVHVEDVALGEQERVVGNAGAVVDRDLLLVVDVLDEAGEPEDIFGHAFAPLPTGLRAGERLTQSLRGGRQRLCGFGVRPQLGLNGAERRGAIALELADELVDPAEF